MIERWAEEEPEDERDQLDPGVKAGTKQGKERECGTDGGSNDGIRSECRGGIHHIGVDKIALKKKVYTQGILVGGSTNENEVRTNAPKTKRKSK